MQQCQQALAAVLGARWRGGGEEAVLVQGPVLGFEEGEQEAVGGVGMGRGRGAQGSKRSEDKVEGSCSQGPCGLHKVSSYPTPTPQQDPSL